MTIEITKGGSLYTYRQNPRNLRLIDWKLNKHRARWEPYFYYDSAEEAAEALWDIEHDDTEQETQTP